MKLTILFITLLLGFSLSLMAKDLPQTGSQSSGTEATAGTNICKDCPDSNTPKGKVSDKRQEAVLCKNRIGGMAPEDSDDVQAKGCPPEHETEGSNGKAKGNK